MLMLANSCNRSSNATTSLTTYPSTDELSCSTYQWNNTLDSCWRDSSDCLSVTTTDDNFSQDSISLEEKETNFWPKPVVVELIVKKEKKNYSFQNFKKLLKKYVSNLSNPLSKFRFHQVYQIDRKKSFKIFNPVQLLNYNTIDDKLHPIEFVLTYFCKTVSDVHDLRNNPQSVAKFLKGDIDAILQDAAFVLSKKEQLSIAENKINKCKTYSAIKQKRRLQLDYIDPRF
uniref:Uncharacterized protein n=1 Tax=Panagrolaimus sp. JU765 TaxID=591449 RepID=A0AC34RQY8_9BILA